MTDKNLFAPPTKEEIAKATAQASESDMFAPPSKEELASIRPRPKTSLGVSALAGAAQFGTAGYADEIPSAISATKDWAAGKLGLRGDISWKDAYDSYLKPTRAGYDAAFVDNPKTYIAGGLVGGAATSFIPGVGFTKGASVLTNMAKAAKIGAVTGAGTSTANPFESYDKAKEFGGDVLTGAATGAAMQGAIQKGLPLLAKGGKKLLGSLGGVSEKNISHYLANSKAVKAAPTLEDIGDSVNTEIGKIGYSVEEQKILKQAAEGQLARLNSAFDQAFSNTRTNIAAKVAEAKNALKSAYTGQLEGLKAKSIPLAHAEEITGLLQNEKAVLGAMSEEADDALAKSGLKFKKADVLQLIDKVGKGLGIGRKNVIVGDEAKAAADKLFSQRQRIADGFGKEISAEDLRGVLSQVRKDINFNTAAGEFNDTLNGARKNFTESISAVLKNQIPAYNDLMGKMAKRAQALSDMNKFFGTREQAIASLEAAASGSSPKAKIVDDVLSNFSSVSGNKDIFNRLGEFREARGVLASPTRKSALLESLPEFRNVKRAEAALQRFNPRRTEEATQLMLGASPQQAAVSSAKDGLADAMTAAKRFSGWSPQSTESKLKSVMGGRSIQNTRALEELGQRTGINFIGDLQNRATADAFEKGYMHGSRNVNLWSFLGSIFGGKAMSGGEGEPLVKLFGVGIGGMIDKSGPKMTQKLLDTFIAIKGSRFAPILEKAAENGSMSTIATHTKLMKDPDYKNIIEQYEKQRAVSNRIEKFGK